MHRLSGELGRDLEQTSPSVRLADGTGDRLAWSERPWNGVADDPDSTVILSSGQVAAWIADARPGSARAFEAVAEPTPDPPPSQAISELFALPPSAVPAPSSQASGVSRLSRHLACGAASVAIVATALALAFPEHASDIYRSLSLVPPSDPPRVITVRHTAADEPPPQPAEGSSIEPEALAALSAQAANALGEGRRADALELYQQLAGFAPADPVYSRIAETLRKTEPAR